MVKQVFFVDKADVAFFAAVFAAKDVQMPAKVLKELFRVVLESDPAHHASLVLP